MNPIAAATAFVTNRHPEARRALLTGSVVDDAKASIAPVAPKPFVLANWYSLLAGAGLS